jgi:endonuclease YncB( thermonuclease family)
MLFKSRSSKAKMNNKTARATVVVSTPFTYNATVIRVIDGDTLRISADLGFSVHTEVTIRLARVNAWEMTEPRGIVARAYLLNLIAACTAMRIATTKQEKYGRWLAEVWLKCKTTDADWFNLADDLVRHSHAAYHSYD